MLKATAAMRLALGLSAAVLFTNCATEGNHQHPISDGWHYATIYRIDSGFEAMHPASLDCRLKDDGSGARYAEVDYRVGRVLRHRIARLPAAGPELHVGDRVYVNDSDCSMPIARRE